MKAINISRCGAQQDFSRHGLPDSSSAKQNVCSSHLPSQCVSESCFVLLYITGIPIWCTQLACPAAKLIALKKAANTSHTASSTAGCFRTTKNSESREYTSKYIHSCSSLMSFSILRMETQENRLQVQSYLQRLCYINILKYTFRRHKNKNFTLKIYPSIKSKRERKINVATSCLHHTTFPSRMLLCLTRN